MACGRVAGVLPLLYAQPLTKISALQTTAVAQIEGETRIALAKEPADRGPAVGST